MTFTLTREQLYELVWSEPMQKIAAQVGISDVAIAKNCRKTGIPVPERGYWNKLQAGQEVTKAELAPRDLGTINHIEMSGTLTPELRARIRDEPGAENENAESIEQLAQRFRKRIGKVSVPRGFANCHPAIAALLRKDEKIRQKHAELPYYWRDPEFETPFERRRLRILNGLFLAITADAGGGGWIRGDKTSEIAITIGSTHVMIVLERIGHQRGRKAPVPADTEDKLRLRIDHHWPVASDVVMHWDDREGTPLEDQMTDIIVGMAVAGEHFRREWIAQQRERDRQRREEEERAARKRREEAERRTRERLAAAAKAKVDALRSDAAGWREAENIRAYVATARMAAAGQAGDAAIERWACWAEGVADRLDPFISGRAIESIRGSAGHSQEVPATPQQEESS
jgi:hypothetical protein